MEEPKVKKSFFQKFISRGEDETISFLWQNLLWLVAGGITAIIFTPWNWVFTRMTNLFWDFMINPIPYALWLALFGITFFRLSKQSKGLKRLSEENRQLSAIITSPAVINETQEKQLEFNGMNEEAKAELDPKTNLAKLTLYEQNQALFLFWFVFTRSSRCFLDYGTPQYLSKMTIKKLIQFNAIIIEKASLGFFIEIDAVYFQFLETKKEELLTMVNPNFILMQPAYYKKGKHVLLFNHCMTTDFDNPSNLIIKSPIFT